MRIYYAKIDVLCEEMRMQRAMQLLPEYRLEKIRKMKQEVGKQQSMAAGLLLEYGLRAYGLSGKQVTVCTNSDGKPYLLEQPHLHYNLSHSGNFVALAMSDADVGIDIEKLRIEKERLAKRFFAKEEYQYLQNTWSDEAFTKMWTRKESVIKACGVGMRMPLTGFSTVNQQVCFIDEVCKEMAGTDEVYFVESFQIEPEYWLSVCQKGKEISGKPQEVTIWDL